LGNTQGRREFSGLPITRARGGSLCPRPAQGHSDESRVSEGDGLPSWKRIVL
jgi:hypothetical protein